MAPLLLLLPAARLSPLAAGHAVCCTEAWEGAKWQHAPANPVPLCSMLCALCSMLCLLCRCRSMGATLMKSCTC